MSSNLITARRYLLPPEKSFWQWSDSGETISWIDGKTITFRAELVHILKELAPQGLPPMGALLLLIAATRDSWATPPDDLAVFAGWLSNSESAREHVNALYDVIEKLEVVHALAADLRTTPEAKATLAQLVFEDTEKYTSAEDAAVITTFLDHQIGELLDPPADQSSSSKTRDYSYLYLGMNSLQRGLERVTPERLRLRSQTGLDNLLQPAPDVPPLGQSVRALLKALEQDDELNGLAKLAHRLMATVTLPRAVVDHEELQVGGVSDITNRGPLDRLLLSELAYDDFALSVRVAMNEALYLRRDSPPRTPPQHRPILLEAGIRSWGVPRVFATAVALAFAATSEQQMEISIYRAGHRKVSPVDLTTKEGLVEHLAVLDPDLHPGAALEAFEREIAADEMAEPVLIVTEEILQDEEFQWALSRSDIPVWHLATVNRDGRFRLIQRTPRGHKLYRESLLNLDDLFAERQRNEPRLIDQNLDTALPAICSMTPFPLLLSYHVDFSQMWRVEGYGALGLSQDRRLMLWTEKKRGAEQITDSLPRGKLWWCTGRPRNAAVQAVVGNSNTGKFALLTIDLEKLECREKRFQLDAGVIAITCHNGVLFAIYKDKVEVLGRVTGQVIQSLNLPTNVQWDSGRYFRSVAPAAWHALSFDGRTAHLELAHEILGSNKPHIIGLFDRDQVDGPIGLTSDLELYFSAAKETRTVSGHPGFHMADKMRSISPDGRYVIVDTLPSVVNHPIATIVIDVDRTACTRFENHSHDAEAWEFRELVHPVNLRHRFVDIYVNTRGSLTLISRKKWHFTIDLLQEEIVLRQDKNPESVPRRQSFNEVNTGSGASYQLRKATWPDGSAAYLDSRGMLHLKSADPNLPEISFVLKDGHLCGWCSNGSMFGRPYFIGDHEAVSGKTVYETVIKLFCKRLQ